MPHVFENDVTNQLASMNPNDGGEGSIVYDFLLKPFGKNHNDVRSGTTQYKGSCTIPDLVISLKDGKDIWYEVKTNNANLTPSEEDRNNRDIFLIPKDYKHKDKIPKWSKNIIYWENLIRKCNENGFSTFDYLLFQD